MFTILERHKEQIHRNEEIGRFLDSLPDNERDVAAKTIDFIKTTFPETNDVLNGELIYEEIF